MEERPYMVTKERDSYSEVHETKFAASSLLEVHFNTSWAKHILTFFLKTVIPIYFISVVFREALLLTTKITSINISGYKAVELAGKSGGGI